MSYKSRKGSVPPARVVWSSEDEFKLTQLQARKNNADDAARQAVNEMLHDLVDDLDPVESKKLARAIVEKRYEVLETLKTLYD